MTTPYPGDTRVDLKIHTNAFRATIGGGYFNEIHHDARYSTIAGGDLNKVHLNAQGASIGGGAGNEVGQNISYATIPGGYDNEVKGHYSFAAGRRAKAIHEGAFVWADARNLDYLSTQTNEFSIRAEGGVRIDSKLGIKLNAINQPIITRDYDRFTSGKNDGVGRWGMFMEPHTLALGIPALSGKEMKVVKYNADSTYTVLMRVDQSGNLITTGAVNPPSDRAAKQDFESVNPSEVLDRVLRLPVQKWSYTNSPTTRHIGPVAQDFHAAFDLGFDDKHIATVDADGVALAAIQGLNQKLEGKLQSKDAEIQELKEELAAVKRLLQKLTMADTRNVYCVGSPK
jgi:hypothetical protein